MLIENLEIALLNGKLAFLNIMGERYNSMVSAGDFSFFLFLIIC